MTQALSVLRIGPVIPGNTLAHRLQKCIINSYNDTNNDNVTIKDDHSHVASIFSIQNKYFTANILLEETCLPITSVVDHYSSMSEDGLILVFNDYDIIDKHMDDEYSSVLISFDSIQDIHEQSEILNYSGELIRLCIAINFGNNKRQYNTMKEYEIEYSRRILWCLDRGYEYVEADLSDHGISIGHDVRDKEGYARIIEAISGTVWSSAIMMSNKKKELKESYAVDKTTIALDVVDEIKTNDSLIKEENKVNETNCDTQRISETTVCTEEINSYYLDNGINNDTETIQEWKQDIEHERQFDSLEGAINEAKSIRELSKSGNLTDEQRRKRAADAAVLLMNMMGIDDESDDDDDEEE